MKPSDYEFAVGDKVITIYGDVGHVIDICRCDRCLERGFCELTWRSDADHDIGWITIYDAEREVLMIFIRSESISLVVLLINLWFVP